jgi:RNA-directed DNA polymerase
VRPWEQKFPGFGFTANREPKRRIAPKAVLRFKERARELTRRARGVKVQKMAEELGQCLRGWIGCFGKSQTLSVLEDLEKWVRRRLGSVIWKQWKRGQGAFCRTAEAGSELRTRRLHGGERSRSVEAGGIPPPCTVRCPMLASTRSRSQN